MSTDLLEELGAAVGPAHVVVEPEVMASYAIDWTGRFRGHPNAVVRPGDGSEVAAVVAVCKEAGVALVPQGGNTGLVGGSVPLAGEVVLSLRRLAGVTDVDPLGGQLSAGAGTTVADVQAAAASPAGHTGSTSAAATVRRSVAPSPPMLADSRFSVMAPRGRSSSASKLCSGRAKPSRTWAV